MLFVKAIQYIMHCFGTILYRIAYIGLYYILCDVLQYEHCSSSSSKVKSTHQKILQVRGFCVLSLEIVIKKPLNECQPRLVSTGLLWAEIKITSNSSNKRRTWGATEASSRQSNVGKLPRFPSHSRRLLRVGFGECRNRARSPQTAIVLASLSSLSLSLLPSLLFSQRAKRENACATMPALLHLG